MAWQLVRLRWALLRGALKAGGTPARQSLVGGLGMAGGLGAVIGSLLAFYLPRTSVSGQEDLTSAVFLALLAGWALGPVLALSSENALDLYRLSLFPLRAVELVAGLLLAAPISLGGLFSVLVLLGVLVGTAPAGPGAVEGAVAVVAFLGLCLVTGQLFSASLGALRGSRRWREAAILASPALALLVAVGASLSEHPRASTSGSHTLGSLLPSPHGAAAAAMRWLPSGWPAQALAAGRRGELAWSGGADVATISLAAVAAWLLWRAVIRAGATELVGGTVAGSRGTLVPAWLRSAPPQVQAIAAKELRYLWREPLIRVQMLTSMVVPLAGVVGSLRSTHHGDAPFFAGWLLVWPALAIGSSAANLFHVDGPAWWMNVAAGTSMRTELAGRAVARAVVGLIATLVSLVLVVIVSRSEMVVPAAIGAAAAGFGATLGLGVNYSVVRPVPMAVGGRSGLIGTSGVPGANASAGLQQLLVTVEGMLALAPVLILSWFLPQRSPAQVAALALGVAVGAAAWMAGLHRAAMKGEGRQVELLAVLSQVG